MDDSKRDLIRKLQALSERGVGGEKANAEAMLAKFMEKYGFEDEALDDHSLLWQSIKCSKQQEIMLLNVIATVLGLTEEETLLRVNAMRTEDRRKILLRVLCTNSQLIEIDSMMRFFWRAYLVELKLFQEAFLVRNHVYPVPSKEKAMMSADELERYRRRSFFESNINEVKYDAGRLSDPS